MPSLLFNDTTMPDVTRPSELTRACREWPVQTGRRNLRV